MSAITSAISLKDKLMNRIRITLAAAAVAALTATGGGTAVASHHHAGDGVSHHRATTNGVDYQIEGSASCGKFSITVWQTSGVRSYTVTQDGAFLEGFTLTADDGGANGYPSNTVSRDYGARVEHVIRLKSAGVVLLRLDTTCNGV